MTRVMLRKGLTKGRTMTSMPRDWSVLGERLNAWTPPQGAFDLAGAWSLRYARHALIPELDGTPGRGAQSGTLIIEQNPKNATLAHAVSGDEELLLRATETVSTSFSTPTTVAEIACSKDALLTPRRWSLNIRWQTSAPGNVMAGELDQERSGRVEGKDLIFKANKEHRRPAPERWTSFWNLFAAVQRLPFDAASALTFDLFDEMELHKPGHRLTYIGPQSVTLGGKAMNLQVFEQTGRGVLPWRWWLDSQHRVLLSAGGRRAYLLDPNSKGGVA